MNRLLITIAAFASLSTAAFAEGNHDLDVYAKGNMTVESQAIYAEEKPSTESVFSSESFESEGGRDGDDGRGGAA